LGAEVVELDLSKSFTAARARNAGFARLRELEPEVEFVQFVDGDCEVREGWLEAAELELRAKPELAAVCGRLRERSRSASVYNRLCDLEWHRPSGDAPHCGGIAMIRCSLFQQAGGFDERLIAGEEPDLCIRLKSLGGSIWRLPQDMACHDAGMTRLAQWWRRTRRSGWAFAAGARLHGSLSGGPNVRSVLRALAWGAALPLLGTLTLLASLIQPWFLGIVAAIVVLYLIMGARAAASRRRLGDDWADSMLYAVFCVMGKPAEAAGVFEYWLQHLLRRDAKLIEYK